MLRTVPASAGLLLTVPAPNPRLLDVIGTGEPRVRFVRVRLYRRQRRITVEVR